MISVLYFVALGYQAKSKPIPTVIDSLKDLKPLPKSEPKDKPVPKGIDVFQVLGKLPQRKPVEYSEDGGYVLLTDPDSESKRQFSWIYRPRMRPYKVAHALHEAMTTRAGWSFEIRPGRMPVGRRAGHEWTEGRTAIWDQDDIARLIHRTSRKLIDWVVTVDVELSESGRSTGKTWIDVRDFRSILPRSINGEMNF